MVRCEGDPSWGKKNSSVQDSRTPASSVGLNRLIQGPSNLPGDLKIPGPTLCFCPSRCGMGPGISGFNQLPNDLEVQMDLETATGFPGQSRGLLPGHSWEKLPNRFVTDLGAPGSIPPGLFHVEALQPGINPVQNAQSLSLPIHRMGKKKQKCDIHPTRLLGGSYRTRWDASRNFKVLQAVRSLRGGGRDKGRCVLSSPKDPAR